MTAYARGLRRVRQPRRCSTASRRRARRRSCSASRSSRPRPWPPRSGSATRPAGRRRWTRSPRSRGRIAAVSDEEILSAYRLLASGEGVFCEPASAASVAGLLAHGLPVGRGTRGSRDRRLRAHRARPQGPRHGARQGSGGGRLRSGAGRRRADRLQPTDRTRSTGSNPVTMIVVRPLRCAGGRRASARSRQHAARVRRPVELLDRTRPPAALGSGARRRSASAAGIHCAARRREPGSAPAVAASSRARPGRARRRRPRRRLRGAPLQRRRSPARRGAEVLPAALRRRARRGADRVPRRRPGCCAARSCRSRRLRCGWRAAASTRPWELAAALAGASGLPLRGDAAAPDRPAAPARRARAAAG